MNNQVKNFEEGDKLKFIDKEGTMSKHKFRSKGSGMPPFTNVTSSEIKRIQVLTTMTTRLRGDQAEDKVSFALTALQYTGEISGYQQTEHWSLKDHTHDFCIQIKKQGHFYTSPEIVSIRIQVKSSPAGIIHFWQDIVKGEREWVPVLAIVPGSSLEKVKEGLKLLISRTLEVVDKRHKYPPPVVMVGENGPQIVKVKRNGEGQWIVVEPIHNKCV